MFVHRQTWGMLIRDEQIRKTWFASVSTAGLAANDEFRVTVGGIPLDERKERFSALRGVCKNIIFFISVFPEHSRLNKQLLHILYEFYLQASDSQISLRVSVMQGG